MIRTLCFSTVFLAMTASQGFAAMKAQEFVDKAAAGGMFEEKSSQLANERLQEPGLRDFAKEMIEDHGKASDELKSIAKKEGLSVPSEMDQVYKDKLNKLQNDKQNFRTAYISMQQDAHREAVDLFQTYAKEGDNEELKKFASKTLSVLKDHHEDIEALAKGVKMTK